MSELPENHDRRKGTEVFVGGLPRAISEDKIRQVFSSCGEIVEVRMIKDQNGGLKGFCFVRFATKDAASRAVKEVSGTAIDGKKIGVLPSIEQDTLYFGNLNKAWSAQEFEKIVLQVFPDVASVDLTVIKDKMPGQKQQNRGFAFVKFSSHQAAARALRVGSQPDFRLGNLHPAIQWAEEEPEIDLKELAKIKIAFVRNLPIDTDEKFLEQLFDPFGKVEKVVLSKKGSSPVGFVHFTERSDLDRAIKELNEKTICGPTGASMHKLQVEVARPMNKNKKRAHEEIESSPSVQVHPKLLKEDLPVASSISHNLHIQRELVSADPYEDAVIALPLPVKERLLRILRLGIATRFDIDVKSLRSLKELPESAAITVLDQFMLSGSASQDKGAYLAGLISKHLFNKVGLSQGMMSSSKHVDNDAQESKLIGYSHFLSSPAVRSVDSHAHSALARTDIYAPHYSPQLLGHPSSSRAIVGKTEEKGSEFHLSSGALPMSQGVQIPRIATLDERIRSSQISGIGSLEERILSSQIPRTGSLEERIRSSQIPGTGSLEDRILASQIPRMGSLEDRIRTSQIPGTGSLEQRILLSQIPRTTSLEERIRSSQIPGAGTLEERIRSSQIPGTGNLEERVRSSYEAPPGSGMLYGRTVIKAEERRVSPGQAARSLSTAHAPLGLSSSSGTTPHAPLGLSSNSGPTPVADRQAFRPQMRFDPFTGEPYKFDPFTGEPILPGP